MASVMSVNISDRRGVRKNEVPEIRLSFGVGIEGDGHAGNHHRQVSLLADESIEKMRAKGLCGLTPGAFAENIVTEGIELKSLKVGTRLRVGNALLAVTQIGKDCHNDGCAIKRATGECVMPTEGIFTIVLEGGTVKKGDIVELV